MDIIPAIDIKGGRCVRLFRGDFSRETVYSPEPVAVAQRWQAEGAARLHIVDLDGAREGQLSNLATIREILSSVRLPLQLGGGIRELGTIEALLSLGIDRVVLGTAAVLNPELVVEACRRFGDRMVVSIDARRGIVRIKGWRDRSGLKATQMAQQMAQKGVPRLIYTDISRDGTLTQPNFAALAELVSQVPLPVIASGGVSSLEHLSRLAALGVEGAIVGKALYAGSLSLPEALRTAGQLSSVKPGHAH